MGGWEGGDEGDHGKNSAWDGKYVIVVGTGTAIGGADSKVDTLSPLANEV